MAKKFKLRKGLKKALLAGGALAIGMTGAVECLGGLTDPGKLTAIGVVSAVVAGGRLGWNWWKVNQDLAGKVSPR